MQHFTRREVLTAAAALCGPRSVAAQSAKPNLVILLADDLGSGDLGFRGCTDIKTPNLDQLAAGGVQFTHAYSNGPVCSPTRAALLTGQYQQRHGVDGVIYVQERERCLAPSALLLPEILKKHGYATGMFGKWHLGYPKSCFPTRQGFDEFIGFLAGNVDYFHHVDRLRNPDLWNGEKPLSDGRYMSRLIADESIGFINRHRSDPFFLYVPFSAPHDPFQGPGDAAGGPFQEERSRAKYKEMVEALDANVGRILDHLRRRGLEENTAIFFLSDNGGVPAVARNAPFRGFKGSLWEGGIRTPFVAHWKGQFPARRKTAAMVAGMDLFPTCLSLAGIAPEPGHMLDGVDLAGVCRGKGALRRDTLCFHYQAPKQNAQRALVRSGWKYLRDVRGDEYLFDLTRDVQESRNAASEKRDLLARLSQDYDAWRKDVFRSTESP